MNRLMRQRTKVLPMRQRKPAITVERQVRRTVPSHEVWQGYIASIGSAISRRVDAISRRSSPYGKNYHSRLRCESEQPLSLVLASHVRGVPQPPSIVAG